MSELIRFGISIDSELLENFDTLIANRKYANRSEAIRDLIRDELIRLKIETKKNVKTLGSLTLVYDHHAKNLAKEMGEIQHDFHKNILSVMHLHVSHDDCMEIIALSGFAEEIVKLSNMLLCLKGIKHGKLFLTLPSSKISA
ncbi:MAG: nickel-responsive transcriptional regulator NikR [Pyrinomonadaceae bacterium]